MANPELLKILKRGVEPWNAWRKATEDASREGEGEYIEIDLTYADLHETDLREVNFSLAKLTHADLWRANLIGADLSDADLKGANLVEAKLNFADLHYAKLMGADLRSANLINANLSKVEFVAFRYVAPDFFPEISSEAHLEQPQFTQVRLGETIFGNVDLRGVIGLDTAIHQGPSTLGIDTIYKSQGEIPDKFLRDAGVPEEMIDLARTIRAGPPIQWHSCFISHSTKDEEFARRLHSRMRETNMRVWLAQENLKGGKKLHEQLFEAIQIHDRLLIVVSEHSIQSEWVMTEIRKAREVEKKEKRRKLFPIRLTDFETLRDWTCFDADSGKDLAVELREYFIPDFSNWKDHDAFESAFARLRKDLEAENPK